MEDVLVDENQSLSKLNINSLSPTFQKRGEGKRIEKTISRRKTISTNFSGSVLSERKETSPHKKKIQRNKTIKPSFNKTNKRPLFLLNKSSSLSQFDLPTTTFSTRLSSTLLPPHSNYQTLSTRKATVAEKEERGEEYLFESFESKNAATNSLRTLNPEEIISLQDRGEVFELEEMKVKEEIQANKVKDVRSGNKQVQEKEGRKKEEGKMVVEKVKGELCLRYAEPKMLIHWLSTKANRNCQVAFAHSYKLVFSTEKLISLLTEEFLDDDRPSTPQQKGVIRFVALWAEIFTFLEPKPSSSLLSLLSPFLSLISASKTSKFHSIRSLQLLLLKSPPSPSSTRTIPSLTDHAQMRREVSQVNGRGIEAHQQLQLQLLDAHQKARRRQILSNNLSSSPHTPQKKEFGVSSSRGVALLRGVASKNVFSSSTCSPSSSLPLLSSFNEAHPLLPVRSSISSHTSTTRTSSVGRDSTYLDTSSLSSLPLSSLPVSSLPLPPPLSPHPRNSVVGSNKGELSLERSSANNWSGKEGKGRKGVKEAREEEKRVNVNEVLAKELAKQLTLLEHTLFSKLECEELMSGKYEDAKKNPNIHLISNNFNNLSLLVASEIIFASKVDRLKVKRHFFSFPFISIPTFHLLFFLKKKDSPALDKDSELLFEIK